MTKNSFRNLFLLLMLFNSVLPARQPLIANQDGSSSASKEGGKQSLLDAVEPHEPESTSALSLERVPIQSAPLPENEYLSSGIKAVGSVLFIVGVILMTSFGLKRFLPQRFGPLGTRKLIQVMETVSLGEKGKLSLVKVGKENFLVASTPSSISVLRKIEWDSSWNAVVGSNATEDENRAIPPLKRVEGCPPMGWTAPSNEIPSRKLAPVVPPKREFSEEERNTSQTRAVWDKHILYSCYKRIFQKWTALVSSLSHRTQGLIKNLLGRISRLRIRAVRDYKKEAATGLPGEPSFHEVMVGELSKAVSTSSKSSNHLFNRLAQIRKDLQAQ